MSARNWYSSPWASTARRLPRKSASSIVFLTTMGVRRTPISPGTRTRRVRAALAARSTIDLAHGVDGVRFGRRFVGAITLHARESQRQATRVMRACLHIVERDLGDELRTNIDGVVVSGDLERQELFGLPGEHLVRHPLERFSEHDEPSANRIARAQVQIAQPSPPPAVPPFSSEDHEVQRARHLYLQPLLTAAAGGVAGGKRLHHHTFVATLQRVLHEARGVCAAWPPPARHEQRTRNRGERREAFGLRLVDQRCAVDVQAVKAEW